MMIDRKRKVAETIDFVIKAFHKFIPLEGKLNPMRGDSLKHSTNENIIISINNSKEIDRMKRSPTCFQNCQSNEA